MTGLLCLWNDLAPGQEAAYEAWHTREHVPERVAAPGFVSGRRYRHDTHPEHRWFTLYELETLAALDTPEYRDLMANPTPASAAMRPHFRSFLRAPCELVAEVGFGMGAVLGVARLEAPVEPVLAPGVVRVRVARHVTDGLPTPGWVAGSGERFGFVLLVEGLDHASVAAAMDGQGALYDLLFAFPAASGEREAHRRGGGSGEAPTGALDPAPPP